MSAELIRSPKSVEKQAPMRAFRGDSLAVRSERHRLGVRIEAPPEIRPNTTVDVKVKGFGSARFRALTLTVDEGIPRITGFWIPPDPFAFFTRKRRIASRPRHVRLCYRQRFEKATSILRGGGGMRRFGGST